MRAEFSGALTLLAALLGVAIGVGFVWPTNPVGAIAENLLPHLAAMLLLVGLGLLAMRYPWRSVLVLLAVGATTVGLAPAFLPGQLPGGSGNRIQVISFNILSSNADGGEAIARMLVQSPADLVFVQEALPLLPYLEYLDGAFPFRAGCGRGVKACDLMLLSRLPLSEPQFFSLGPLWSNRAVEAKVQVDGQTVRLVGVHLSKPYFDGFAAGEREILRQRLGSPDGMPLVLAGDFNAAGWTSGLRRLFNRGGLAPGRPEPSTWPVWAGPLGVPLDHIAAREAHILEVSPLPDAFGSNHRGLMADIEFDSAAAAP